MNHTLYTNDTDTLRIQEHSNVMNAASCLGYRVGDVAWPACAGRHVRNAAEKAIVPLAIEPQLKLLQSAYAGANSLTILDRSEQLRVLMKAEEAELMAAALGTAPPDKSLCPRAVSLTLLVYGKLETHMERCRVALDAMQFLARSPGSPGVRAVQGTRMTALFGQNASAYACARRGDWHCVKNPTTSMAVFAMDICLAWTENVPESENEMRFRAEFASLKPEDTADDLALQIRQQAFELWTTCGHFPETRLAQSYPDHGAVGAYAQGVVDCAAEFFEIVMPPVAIRRSRFATELVDTWDGSFDFSRLFVRLVPKPGKNGLAGPDAYHGLLIHQIGYDEEAREFCRRVKEEEEQRGHGVWGLRQPATSAEQALAPHVLSISADIVQLGDRVTSYCLEAVPGHALSGELGSGCMRLHRRIDALDGALLDSAFVLPCEFKACIPGVAELRKPYFVAIQDAIWNFQEHFPARLEGKVDGKRKHESAEHSAECERHKRVREELCSRSMPPLEANEDDMEIKKLLGLRLDTPALRVGDAYNELVQRRGDSPLLSLISSLGTVHGVDTALGDAFDRTADLLKQQEALKARHRDEVAALKEDLRKQSEEAPDSETQEVVRVDKRSWDRLMTGIGHATSDMCAMLPLPFDKKATKATLKVMATAASTTFKALPTEITKRMDEYVVPSTTCDANIKTIAAALVKAVGSIKSVVILSDGVMYEVSGDTSTTQLSVAQILSTGADSRCFVTWDSSSRQLGFSTPAAQAAASS